MDDTLLKYDESLEALEKQRENLELVMKKMGAEWEESGAGIGWMGDILYNTTTTTTTTATATKSTNTHCSNNTPPPPPLISLMQSVTSATAEPSHDYLQTLLNVNDELLAQSLASSADSNSSNRNYSNIHDYRPQLLKTTAFVSQQPILPSISQDDNINTSHHNQQPVNIVQLTPPITPD